MSRLVAAVALSTALMGLLGCGGGNGVVTPPWPHPSSDNAVVTGQVVRADDVLTGISGAIVSEPTTGMQTTTDVHGAYRLGGLPGGNVHLHAAVPSTPGYDSADVTVATTANKTTANVNIAVLPVSVGTPTQLSISPLNPSVSEPTVSGGGGTIQFTAAIYVGSKLLSVQPSWILSGSDPTVGEISPSGAFTALKVGSMLLTATTGGLTVTTGVIVTGGTPPDITSVLVSASTDVPLPASGGAVTIVAAISSADGIKVTPDGDTTGLQFEIYRTRGDAKDNKAPQLVAGTIYDGTWRLVYIVGPNANVPDASGVQDPEHYSVRVAARDLAGRPALSDFYDFLVAGVEPPPTK